MTDMTDNELIEKCRSSIKELNDLLWEVGSRRIDVDIDVEKDDIRGVYTTVLFPQFSKRL